MASFRYSIFLSRKEGGDIGPHLDSTAHWQSYRGGGGVLWTFAVRMRKERGRKVQQLAATTVIEHDDDDLGRVRGWDEEEVNECGTRARR